MSERSPVATVQNALGYVDPCERDRHSTKRSKDNMKLERILVSSDLLRVTGKAQSRAGFRTNTEFFLALLGPQLRAATRLPVSLLEWDETGAFDGNAVYEAMGLSVDAAGWAEIYDSVPNAAAVAAFAPHVEGALVVGFELPPFIQRILDRLGVPFVDARWHPLRFLDDIFFGFHSNIEAIVEAIEPYHLTAEEVDLHVGMHQASAIRRQGFDSITVDYDRLLIGQTPFDSSLVHAGRIATWDDFEPVLEKLGSDARTGYRPHPFSPEPVASLRALLSRYGIGIAESGSDMYRLLATGSLKELISLSSGTLIEASFFGIPVRRLLPERQAYLPHPPQTRRTENDQTAYAGVYHEFLSVDFWADILRPLLGKTYRNERPLAFRADRLRQINGSYWGYSGSGGQNLVMSYNKPE